MKLKERIRAAKVSAEDSLQEAIRPHAEKLEQKLGIRQRIANLGAWCAQNPRGMFVGVVTILVVLTAISIFTALYEGKHDGNFLDGIDDTSSQVFDNVRVIESQNEEIKAGFRALGEEGLRRKAIIDSIMALPVRTHEDSIVVLTNMQRIQTIYNFLKNNEIPN